MLRTDIHEILARFERGQVTRDELPEVAVQAAENLACLVRIGGALIAGLLARPRISYATKPSTSADDGARTVPSERIALKVAEAANMLGVSRSALYEMIYKRKLGVVRFGNRSIRVPRTEIDRLMADSRVPALLK